MDIHEEVKHILAGLQFEEQRTPTPTLRQRIRTFLVECVDPAWQKCTLLEHLMLDGSRVYTASRLCIACGSIHTFILTLNPSGEWELAAPSPVAKDEY